LRFAHAAIGARRTAQHARCASAGGVVIDHWFLTTFEFNEAFPLDSFGARLDSISNETADQVTKACPRLSLHSKL
jgi:hypothetical protein